MNSRPQDVSSFAAAAAPDAPPPPDDPGHPRAGLHSPVDVRNAALAVIAVIACLFAMQWAKALLIPILLGVMLSYALAPVVNQLQRWHVPRPLSAGLLLTAIVTAGGWGVWTLSDEASALVETLPQVTQKLRELTRGHSGPASTIEKVQRAAIELQQAAADSVPGSSAPPAARVGNAPRTRVVVENPGFNVRDYLLTGTLGVFTLLGQTAIVLLITLFLLASGNTFRRKMVRLAGPRLSQKKITVQALNEITEQIQRYLLVQLAVSALVGTATGLAFYAIGLQQPAVWGVVAALTNLVPYVGAVVVGVGAALVASLQFASIDMALLVAATSFGIRGVVGNLVTPWLTGRTSRMSPFAVFVGVLAFGWLWGAWGLVLGVPILMVVKSVCDRVDDLKPVGELLGA